MGRESRRDGCGTTEKTIDENGVMEPELMCLALAFALLPFASDGFRSTVGWKTRYTDRETLEEHFGVQFVTQGPNSFVGPIKPAGKRPDKRRYRRIQ